MFRTQAETRVTPQHRLMRRLECEMQCAMHVSLLRTKRLACAALTVLSDPDISRALLDLQTLAPH